MWDVKEIQLKVAKAYPNDSNRGIARLDPNALLTLKLSPGEIIEIEGKRLTAAIVWRADRQDWSQDYIRIDGFIRQNAGVDIEDQVNVRKAKYNEAIRVSLAPPQGSNMHYGQDAADMIRRQTLKRPIVSGDILPIMSSASHPFIGRMEAIPLVVTGTDPDGIVVIGERSELVLEKPTKKVGSAKAIGMTYENVGGATGMTCENVGGLKAEVQGVREMIELPMKPAVPCATPHQVAEIASNSIRVTMADKQDSNQGLTNLDAVTMLLGGGNYNERMVKKENAIRQRVLYYLERDELPFVRRLQYCQQWLEKTLEEKYAEKAENENLSKEHKRDMERRSSEAKSEEDRQKILGEYGLPLMLSICQAGDAKTEIKILERLLEEIKITSEIPQNRINEGDFTRRVMDIIYIPKNEFSKNEEDRLPTDNTKPGLRTSLSRNLIDPFQRDNPNYQRNVFIMMPFADTPELKSVWSTLQEHLATHELVALRTDMKTYGESRQLWDNLIVYMHGCNYGIAVLEDYSSDEFNPNVALEFGFMRALGKQVLLLKEKRFKNVRADILGTIWIEFDILNVSKTIEQAIDQWIKDIT